MNYYKRHLGDYAKDTGWLSTYQHGVYALLLDWYYSNERAIPLDIAYRIVKARSGPERKATQEVLAAFFDLNKHGGFAHNKHADIEISKYLSKSATNSLIAKEREATKRAHNVGDSCGSGEPSHKPLATSHKKEEEQAAAILIPLDDGTDHPVTAVMVAEFKSAYPRIDVLAELRKARAWCLASPSNRKTRKGVGRFVNGWLSRADADAAKSGNVVTLAAQPGGGRRAL